MMQTDREYAQALFMLAVEENSAGEYLDALNSIKSIIEENPDYIEFLASPAISQKDRTQAIEDAFGETMPEYVVSFLKVLCENGKIRTLFGCIDEFAALVMAVLNRTTASIYSAVPLSDVQKKGICEKLEKITKKQVDPIYIIDKNLIGGLKVEVEGKTFDGTVRHRLQEVKDVII